MANEDNKALLFSILNYFEQLNLDATALEIVCQCIEEQTGVNHKDPVQQQTYSTAPYNLLHLFQVGKQTLATPPPDFTKKFVPKITESGYFNNVAQGTPEHADLHVKALVKFLGRQPQASEAAPAPAPEVKLDPAQAEEFKSKGNTHLNAKQYGEAIQAYSKAIELNPNNSIYFANRGLAYIETKNFREAVKDCTESIRLDSKYSKAHYRLGLAHMGLGQFAEAARAFESALQYNSGDPSHIQEKLNLARQNMGQQPQNPFGGMGANPFAAMGGMGGMGGMPNMGGMGGPGGIDINGLLNNPMLQQMAAQVMSNPQMLNNIMSGLQPEAPAGQPAAAFNPMDLLNPEKFQQILNSPKVAPYQNDPVLGPVLEDLRRNGAMAALNYINNQEVMGKLMNLMNSA